jgi:hypothetical protein
VSSLGSEALHIKINTNVTATIGDTNVELWCSYIKDGGDYIYYIKMEARNKTSEEYLQRATFYPPELLVCPLQTLRMNQMKLFLTFDKIQCVDDTDYICSISYRTNRIVHKKQTISTNINVTRK